MNYKYKLDSYYRDLVEDYLKILEIKKSDYLLLLKEGDFEALRVIGHNLAGTGGSYGLTFLVDVGDAIELSAKNDDYKKCEDAFSRLIEFLKKVEIEYLNE